jgi:hypothetical protein|tara:strand:+ start:257 stop:2335 length:2079 start_codon:yes stop_codon:yes gene_type:complete
MANTIQIKRSTGSAAPGSLANGELAHTQGSGLYSNVGGRLLIGDASGIEVIGGEYFTTMLDHAPGVLTATSGLITDSDSALSSLITGNHTSAAGTVVFNEGTANGTNKITLAGVASLGADRTLTLPDATDTLVGKATTDALTNKTLTDPVIANITSGANITLDATADIVLDAGGANITMKDDGTTVLDFVANGTTDITLDAPGDLKLDAGGADVALLVSGTQYGSLSKTGSGSNLVIKSGSTTAATFTAANVILAGTVGSGAITSTGVVTGTGFTIGSAVINESDLEQLDDITKGTAAANKALVLDASTNITGIGTIGSGAITSTGNVTAVGSFIIGSADMSEVDLEKLDGITNGTAAGSKAVVLDANKDIATLRNVTLDGTLIADDISITNATISTTASNNNIVLSPHGSGTVDVATSRITGVVDPTGAQDAATKGYVDAVKSGLDIKDSVDCATTATLAYTYNNGAGTLTNGSNGVITLDGVALTADMRVLVKDQTDTKQNGIYSVTTAGAVSAALVLTRSTDADTAAEFTGGSFTYVEQGTIAAENGYVFTHNGTPTIGTTLLTVSQFSGAGQVIAGTGLTKSGNTINAVGTADVITVSADAITIANTYVGQSSIVTVGTVTTGRWQSTTEDIGVAYGGTGASSFTSNGILFGNSAGAIQVTAAGSDAYFLKSNSGTPEWSNVIDGGTF